MVLLFLVYKKETFQLILELQQLPSWSIVKACVFTSYDSSIQVSPVQPQELTMQMSLKIKKKTVLKVIALYTSNKYICHI